MNQPKKRHIESQINQAFQHLNKGRQEAAQSICGEILGDPPDDIETLVQLGLLCTALARTPQAIAIFSRAVESKPDSAVYLGYLGRAFMEGNQWLEADAILRMAVQKEPGLPEPLINLGAVNVRLGNYSEAIELLERAMTLKPSEPNIYANITIALSQTGRHAEALKYSEKALRLDPGNPNSYDSLGRLLTQLGRADEAIPNFEKAIKLNRIHGLAYQGIANARKFSEKDQAFIKRTEQTLKESMPAEQRAYFHFSLGKMYDDCKQWDKAFQHYRQGNLLKKSAFDPELPSKLFKQVKKVFTREQLREAERLGSESEVPVFIVGMPRSGTTLVEQIIASHPDASGAGELQEIDRIAKRICPASDLAKYQSICSANLTRSMLNEQADSYLKVLRKTRESASRITDKMPDNYFYLGLITMLFPRARIIHMIRNPLDNCLSCYFQCFNGLAWSFDLDWLGKRYRFYREVMAYWKSVLPADRILDVYYEQLIEDPEIQSRRIVEGCGLPWDPSCLDFDKAERAVNTASMWQVRQPIYRSSTRRWQNYAPHLGELANALGNYLDEDSGTLEAYGIKSRSRWGLGFLSKKHRA